MSCAPHSLRAVPASLSHRMDWRSVRIRFFVPIEPVGLNLANKIGPHREFTGKSSRLLEVPSGSNDFPMSVSSYASEFLVLV